MTDQSDLGNWRGTYAKDRAQFLAYCAEQVIGGECDLSSGELGVLLGIVFELEHPTKAAGVQEQLLDEQAANYYVKDDGLDICLRCHTAIRPEGGHICGSCGRDI